MTDRTADKIIDFFRESQRVVLGFVDSLDLTFISLVTRLAPIVAPAPAAYSVYRAMKAIHTPEWVAILTAVTVELIGMFQSKTALRARNWNLVKLKSDPGAPFDLALAMAAIYFVVAFGLTTIIEFRPDLSHIIYPAFIVFAASVYVSNAVASDLTRWETDRSDRLRDLAERAGLKADIKRLSDQANRLTEKVKKLANEAQQLDREIVARQAKLDKLAGQNNGFGPHNLPKARAAKKDNRAARRTKLADIIEDNSDLTNRELADQLGVSVTTIKNDKKALNGQLNGHTNGQGVNKS